MPSLRSTEPAAVPIPMLYMRRPQSLAIAAISNGAGPMLLSPSASTTMTAFSLLPGSTGVWGCRKASLFCSDGAVGVDADGAVVADGDGGVACNGGVVCDGGVAGDGVADGDVGADGEPGIDERLELPPVRRSTSIAASGST